jgi:hypothetical protein
LISLEIIMDPIGIIYCTDENPADYIGPIIDEGEWEQMTQPEACDPCHGDDYIFEENPADEIGPIVDGIVYCTDENPADEIGPIIDEGELARMADPEYYEPCYGAEPDDGGFDLSILADALDNDPDSLLECQDVYNDYDY